MIGDEALFDVVPDPAGGFDLPEDLVEPFQFVSARQFATPAAGRAAAVISPLLRFPSAVEDDDQAREAKLAVLALLADRGGVGMTVAQIGERLAGRYARSLLRSVLGVMLDAGSIQRARKNDPRLTPTLQAALALALVPTLVDVHGHRALMEMFDRTRARAGADVSAQELREDLVRLRWMLAIYTSDARRVARDGASDEVLVHTATDDAQLKQRFALLSKAVEHVDELMGELASLNAAVYGYLQAVAALTVRVLSTGRRLADARLLPPEEYQSAARTAGVERLAGIFDGILFDSPPVWIDLEAVERVTVSVVGKATPAQIPEPASEGADGDADGLTLLERWRLHADHLLAGRPEVDLLDPLRSQPWPGPAVTMAEVVALSLADPRYWLRRSEALVVSPHAEAKILTPSTLGFLASVGPSAAVDESGPAATQPLTTDETDEVLSVDQMVEAE